MAEIKKQEEDSTETQVVTQDGASFNDEPPKTKLKKTICVCRKARDLSRPEVVCRACRNIFHKQCVTVKKGTRFYKCEQCVADDKRTTKHCSCSKPHDDRRFYIFCDYCEVWFHGSCEGVTEKQSNSIDKYACAGCRKQSCLTTYN